MPFSWLFEREEVCVWGGGKIPCQEAQRALGRWPTAGLHHSALCVATPCSTTHCCEHYYGILATKLYKPMKDKHTWEHMESSTVCIFIHGARFFVLVGMLTMLVRLNTKGRIDIPSSLIWVYVCVVNAPPANWWFLSRF